MSEAHHRKTILNNQHVNASSKEQLAREPAHRSTIRESSTTAGDDGSPRYPTSGLSPSRDLNAGVSVAAASNRNDTTVFVERLLRGWEETTERKTKHKRRPPWCRPEIGSYCQNLLDSTTESNYQSTARELRSLIKHSTRLHSSVSYTNATQTSILQSLLLTSTSPTSSPPRPPKRLALALLRYQIDFLSSSYSLPTTFCRAIEELERNSVDCHKLVKQLISKGNGILDGDRALVVVEGLVSGRLTLENKGVFDLLVNRLVESSDCDFSLDTTEAILLSLETNETTSAFHRQLSQKLPPIPTMNSSTPPSPSSHPPLFTSTHPSSQIPNLLSDLGPAATSSPSTLRSTLSEITNTLLLTSQPLDESAMAHLLVFFGEKGSAGGSEAPLSAALVGTLLPSQREERSGEWNISSFETIIREDYSSLDWEDVARQWDYPSFHIRSPQHLEIVFKLYRAGAKSSPPLGVLVGQWRNGVGQLTLLSQLISVPPGVYTFTVSPAEDGDAAIAGDRCRNKAWSCTALLRRLLQLSDVPELSRPTRDLFIKGLLKCPEVLLCSLVRLQLQGSDQQSGLQTKGELMKELIGQFFKPGGEVADAPAALVRLWSISPVTVGAACIEAWRSTANETPLGRLATALHVVGITRLLPESMGVIVNNGKDWEFSVAVVFVMCDHDMMNLRAWLNERLQTGAGVMFLVALIGYLGKYYQIAQPRNEGDILLTLENLAESLQFLNGGEGSSLLNQPVPGGTNGLTLADSVKALTEACVSTHRKLKSLFPGVNPAAPSPTPTPPPSSSTSSADDIEEMANSYFQKIYTSEQSIAEVVDMLKKFKVSGNARENDIFACMIHNLFDEYRFFSKYPEKELRITGILFGTLIQEQLVTSLTLGIALRYVLEALRKDPGPRGNTTSSGGKMFRFGMFALLQFKGRLHEWPQYGSHLVKIPHLKQGYADLVAEIEGSMAESQSQRSDGEGSDVRAAEPGAASPAPPVVAPVANGITLPVPPPVPPAPARSMTLPPSLSSLTQPPPTAVFGPGLGRAVNRQSEETHSSPPDRILDQVQFLINNVSPSNVEQKAGELKDLLEQKYFGWLGHYLVVKRISSQPNFHGLYLAFLDQLGEYGKGLVDAILASVYLNVGKLLRSPNITTSTSERSLLKNLGSWLGQITLARNRPILQIMLDCKELLFQGYETGMLIAVTPFVAKILEGAKNSVVFRPPNPWLMGLLSVFRALYNVDDLKMNIKFEVEVLCKKLGMTLDDIPIRNDDLAKRIPPIKERNPDFNIKSSMVTPAPNPPTTTPSTTAPPPTPPSPKSTTDAARPPAPTPESGQTVIPNLAAYVTINPRLSLLNTNNFNITDSSLKQSVPIAVDRAIREIIQPVVERSVTIACITTKDIVTKDFCMEGDETKLRKAAQLMVANLAGSLALVTCREPLRASVTTHLRQLLTTSNLSEQETNAIEQCVAICATDNLELGCMLIEKAATEKAVRDMDESLSASVRAREAHRRESAQPFYDRGVFERGRYPGALPEPLRPSPGGLRPEQLLVYEAFQRLPRQPAMNAKPQGSAPSSPKKGSMGWEEALSAIVQKLETAVSGLLNAAGPRAGDITLAMIPPDHEIRQLIVAVRRVGSGRQLTSGESDGVLVFAQGLFKRLYDLSLSKPLRLESLVMVLESLNAFCPQLGQDLGTWSTYAPTETENQRKLHRTILLLLLRSRLIAANEIDAYIARNMDNGHNATWVEFGFLFIRTALLERIIDARDMPLTLDALSHANSNPAYGKNIRRLLDELHSEKEAPSPQRQMTYQQSSSISPSSLNNLAEGTKKAVEAMEMLSRNDPPGTRQQVTFLLDSWIRVHNEAPGSEKALAQYLQLLQQHGVGKADDITERFFRMSTELVVEACLKTHDEKTKMLNYNVIDAYAKLISLLVRYMNAGGTTDQIAAQRISLLNKLLGTTVRTLMSHYERCKNGGIVPSHWDQRPWFRLLLNLVCDLNAPSPVLDPISLGILSIFGSAFHVVQPLVVPGFSFAWLELISHRMFLSNILLLKNQKGWGVAHQLLIDLFLFLEPHLRKTELTDAIKHLYKGTLRVLLVLLHDFPTFLAGYHLSFCNVIPENCVQLRNLILSAFPRGMVLPDPFTPNLKIDRLPEISQSPVILSNLSGPLQSFRNELDTYLKSRQPSNFISTLLPRLYKDNSSDISPPRINSLVLYVGIQAIARLQNSQIAPQIAHTPEMEILQKLMDFDDRGRYISLNAIANQLRYPSSHTHYFSCVMLFLFGEAKDDGVKEQVTRVLLERLIVHRPHPWGLLITFIELIKNQRYQFWSHSFTRCATEIEKVFESVARSCMTPESQRTATTGGDDPQ